MTAIPPSFGALSPAECVQLLVQVPVGRIAYTVHAVPVISPVNFILDGDDVVIRVQDGTKLAAAMRNAVVAFEADEIFPETRSGWSVVVIGRARPVSDPVDLAWLSGRLESWACGQRPHFIRIAMERLSGRCIRGALVEIPQELAG